MQEFSCGQLLQIMQQLGLLSSGNSAIYSKKLIPILTCLFWIFAPYIQIILGYSAVHVIMNLYCHVTEDMIISEMSKFENGASEHGVNHQNGVKVV